MGAVRPEYQQELEEKLMGIAAFGVARETVLAPDLAEFTGPVGQHAGGAAIHQGGVARPVGAVVTTADRPTPIEPVIRGRVKAEGALDGGWLLASTPDELGPREEIVINGSAQRLPAECRVEILELRTIRAAQVVMTPGQ